MKNIFYTFASRGISNYFSTMEKTNRDNLDKINFQQFFFIKINNNVHIIDTFSKVSLLCP